jgi:hypothetical protein
MKVQVRMENSGIALREIGAFFSEEKSSLTIPLLEL